VGKEQAAAEAGRAQRSSRSTTSPAASVNEPYLSIILAARNDGHEGNFLHRLQNCLDQIIVLSRRSPALSIEVLIVEWNPPPSSPALASVLKWPSAPFHARLRIIRVHQAAAATLDFLHRDPFPQVFLFRRCFSTLTNHLLSSMRKTLLCDERGGCGFSSPTLTS
jgi:hypothetical protein